ncbi:MAG: type IX secretion system sortase PorU, partial [Bacteroidota bacterium]
EIERRAHYGKLFFIPFIKNGNTIQKVKSFELAIEINRDAVASLKGPDFVSESILNSGDIYQISIGQSSIYKLDYDFLKNTLGIENLDNIDPRQIQMFANGAGPIEEKISDFKDDDLVEQHILIEGEGDGSFDASDYILFYGQGPRPLIFNEFSNRFDINQNPYSLTNNYFIKLGSNNGLRIPTVNNISNTEYQTDAFDEVQRLEKETINLLADDPSNLGSGKDWYGDEFTNIRNKDYSNEFDFTGIIPGESIKVYSKFAGRSNNRQSYTLNINGQSISATISSTNTGDPERPIARIGTINQSIINNQSSANIQLEYPTVSGTSTGWLDFIQVNFRKTLSLNNNIQFFRDDRTKDYNSIAFSINGVNENTVLWNVSNPNRVLQQDYNRSGTNLTAGIQNNQQVGEYVVFNKNGSFINATAIGKINNQNLHGINETDVLLIYHPDFELQAMRLAEHRASNSGFTVSAVPIDQVYNEFSGGRVDPTAIRNFAKMLHDRTARFKYLILFGDASYDYRNLNDEIEDNNFIPAYETDESLDPIDAFPSDDFYALLSDNEGGNLRGAIDIAVGRFPVKTIEEAEIAVSKIINYDTNPSTLGDWRLRLAYVADDEDGNTHLRQADEITNLVDDQYNKYNVEKIYFDAFPQISTPGGERYPDANSALNSNMFKGLFMVNY